MQFLKRLIAKNLRIFGIKKKKNSADFFPIFFIDRRSEIIIRSHLIGSRSVPDPMIGYMQAYTYVSPHEHVNCTLRYCNWDINFLACMLKLHVHVHYTIHCLYSRLSFKQITLNVNPLIHYTAHVSGIHVHCALKFQGRAIT